MNSLETFQKETLEVAKAFNSLIDALKFTTKIDYFVGDCRHFKQYKS